MSGKAMQKHSQSVVKNPRCCLVTQSCPTLWPHGLSARGLSPGILQAWILQWVDISFSRDLPGPGISPMSHALAGRFFIIWASWEAQRTYSPTWSSGSIMVKYMSKYQGLSPLHVSIMYFRTCTHTQTHTLYWLLQRKTFFEKGQFPYSSDK